MSNDKDVPRFLPVAVDLRDRQCLVIGGGTIGTRKALTLAQARASVTVVSPEVTEELGRQIEHEKIRWIKGIFRKEHVDGAFLVVAATDDEKLNETIVLHASHCGALVCDTSSADRSDLIFGALHRTADATFAVFTDGRDPSHARNMRYHLAELLAQADDPQS